MYLSYIYVHITKSSKFGVRFVPTGHQYWDYQPFMCSAATLGWWPQLWATVSQSRLASVKGEKTTLRYPKTAVGVYEYVCGRVVPAPAMSMRQLGFSGCPWLHRLHLSRNPSCPCVLQSTHFS